ncbi:hypothetical protein G5I_06440 [Acromyrmex echinatior]|uniref:Uncharacterized protein n=1 Tax=Acromyrmex echinatior TaxID=103372 RepID=F4WL17_ACREC|nr:hypothetical protein G5I_06440 [Acromyrmex echinatior]
MAANYFEFPFGIKTDYGNRHITVDIGIPLEFVNESFPRPRRVNARPSIDPDEQTDTCEHEVGIHLIVFHIMISRTNLAYALLQKTGEPDKQVERELNRWLYFYSLGVTFHCKQFRPSAPSIISKKRNLRGAQDTNDPIACTKSYWQTMGREANDCGARRKLTRHLTRNELPRTHSTIVYHAAKKSVDQAYVYQFPLECLYELLYVKSTFLKLWATPNAEMKPCYLSSEAVDEKKRSAILDKHVNCIVNIAVQVTKVEIWNVNFKRLKCKSNVKVMKINSGTRMIQAKHHNVKGVNDAIRRVMTPDKLIAEFAATNFNPPCLRSGVRRVLQGHQAGGMPLSRFHLEYRGISPAVFQPSSDYVSRNTIEFSRTIDGGGLSTARERTSRPPKTLTCNQYQHFAEVIIDQTCTTPLYKCNNTIEFFIPSKVRSKDILTHFCLIAMMRDAEIINLQCQWTLTLSTIYSKRSWKTSTEGEEPRVLERIRNIRVNQFMNDNIIFAASEYFIEQLVTLLSNYLHAN